MAGHASRFFVVLSRSVPRLQVPSQIADLTPSAHAQSDIPGHTSGRSWLAVHWDKKKLLRTDGYG